MRLGHLLLLALGFAVVGLQGQTAHAPAGYLGIAYVDIDANRAKELRLPQEAGVEITLLVANAPAAAAGIRLGDVIMQFNNQLVEGRSQLDRLIRETPPGREVRIQVYRNGYAQFLVAKIGAFPGGSQQKAAAPAGALPVTAVPDTPLPRFSWRNGLGAEWETLDGQLGAYFGVKDGGVLVRSVMNGSAAELAGLRAGDVIVRIGDVKVSTPNDLSARIRAERAQTATVAVVRDHKEMNLTIPLDGGRPGQ